MRLHGLKDCILKSPQIKNEVKEPKPVCCWLPLVLLKQAPAPNSQRCGMCQTQHKVLKQSVSNAENTLPENSSCHNSGTMSSQYLQKQQDHCSVSQLC